MTVAQSVGAGYGAAGAQSAVRQTVMGQQDSAPTDYQVKNPSISNAERVSDSLLNVAESQEFNYAVTAGFGVQAIAAGAGVPFAVGVAAGMAGGYVGAKIGDKIGHGIASALNLNKVATEGQNPAHLGHPIAHQNKDWGVWGAIGGILLGAAAAAFVVVTFGTGLVVIAGAAAAAGLVGGAVAAAGAALGQYGDNKGTIIEGSSNVFFEGKPVARVGDEIVCSDHPSSPPPMIADGAKTVFANQKQIARLGHRTTCDGNINAGCGSLGITQETAYVYEVEDSRNPYLRWSAVILNFLPIQKKFEQGFQSLKKPPNTAVNNANNCPTGSDPVDMISGDYFQVWPVINISGVLPIKLQRFYRSGEYFKVSGFFGDKWADTWSQHLVLQGDSVDYIDEEGVGLSFFTPENTVKSVNLYNLRYKLIGELKGELAIFDKASQQYFHFNQQDGGCRYLSAITDRKGNRIDFYYRQGDLISVEHSDGYTLNIESRNKKIYSVEMITGDKIQNLLKCEFSEEGNLAKCQSFQHGTLFHEYDNNSYMLRWRDTDATDVYVKYDIFGRVVSLRTSSGFFADRFIYNTEEGYTIYRDAEGGETYYYYNENNLLIKLIDPLGNETVTEWDITRKIKETDALGRVTQLIYNECGDVTKVIHPDETRSEYIIDSFGIVTEFKSPIGDVWKYQYDKKGLLRQVTDPSGKTIAYRYGNKGEVLRKIISDNQEWRYHYDDYGCLTSIIDPKGNTTSFCFDLLGRVHLYINSMGDITRYEHSYEHANPVGSVTKVIMPDGSIQKLVYDSERRVQCTIDGEGKESCYHYGAFDLCLGYVRASEQATSYHYDRLTRLKEIVNSTGQRYQLRRNKAGLVIEEIDFTGRSQKYRYDAVGRLICKQVANQVITYHYDLNDHLVLRQSWLVGEKQSQLGIETYFIYDDKGRLISARNTDALVEFSYNQYHQLIAETINGKTTKFQYEENGFLLEQHQDTLALKFSYDPEGSLQNIQINQHDPLRFEYDVMGREIVRESHAGFILAHNYTKNGQLFSQAAGRRSDQLIEQLKQNERSTLISNVINRSWEYDKAFNVMAVDDSQWGKCRYSYDSNNQVVQAALEGIHAKQQQFSYDPELNLKCQRNITHKAVEAVDEITFENRQGRVIRRGNSHYCYNEYGQLCEKRLLKDGFRPQIWKYRWNTEGQMIGLLTPDNQRWRYAYDAFGRRIRKLQIIDGSKDAENGGEPSKLPVASCSKIVGYNYQWQGDRLIEELPIYADGTPAQDSAIYWLYRPDTLTPFARYELGVVHYVVADQIGTPRELLSETGKLAWASRLDVWGKSDLWPKAANDNDNPSCQIRFPGQYLDEESGLHYNRHRYYDNETGQYLMPDPLGLAGGDRLYGYVHNPLTRIDPLGLISCPNKALNTIMEKMGLPGKEVNVSVASKADAEDVLRGYISSPQASANGAFRNTTDQPMPTDSYGNPMKKSDPMSDWLPGGHGAYEKQGTYHYDAADSQAKAGDHALLGDHLQIHTYEGKIIRIFY